WPARAAWGTWHRPGPCPASYQRDCWGVSSRGYLQAFGYALGTRANISDFPTGGKRGRPAERAGGGTAGRKSPLPCNAAPTIGVAGRLRGIREERCQELHATIPADA